MGHHKTFKKYKGGSETDLYKRAYKKGYDDGYENKEYDEEGYDPDGYDEGYEEGRRYKENEEVVAPAEAPAPVAPVAAPTVEETCGYIYKTAKEAKENGIKRRTCKPGGIYEQEKCEGQCKKKTKKKAVAPPAVAPAIAPAIAPSQVLITPAQKKNEKYYYPIYGNENFSNNIASRIEFQAYTEKEDKDNVCQKQDFQLAPYQIFLKNFISRETPYKSILIFHGTGVGKTCSAISIAENFKNIYREKSKKIIILLPDAVKEGWRNNIHNPEQDTNQCTRDEYIRDMRSLKKGYNTNRNLIKDRKKIVNYYYEFSGYRGFINNEVIRVRRDLYSRLGDVEGEIQFKKVIENKFSNRLLIIDEVHNIRNLGKGKKSDDLAEKIFEGLQDIIKNSKNLKLIMLSATPMYNESTEIVKLTNLMLTNDGRPTINKSDIFEESGEFKEGGKEILINNVRGYVSYVRGETPNKFPLRLYPMKSKDSYMDNVKKLDFLQLYTCEYGDYQKKVYEIAAPELEEEINLGEGTQLMEISNMVYPNILEKDITEGNYDRCYGKQGKDSFFDIKKGIYYYKSGAEKIFRYDKINEYSTKLHNLLKKIKESKGIVFIYSRFIQDGAIPIMLALEQNGYKNYSNNDILIDRKDKTDYHHENNKYMVVTGTNELSKNRDKELRVLLSDENINGEKIKIIIGSAVASEGLDLKRIREIHVIDPWYHLNRLEQIIGRGIRYCSHADLEEKDRNVSIYLYAGILEKCNNKDIKDCPHSVQKSIDIKIYEKAAEKSKYIGTVEKLLKENAIDCGLFKNINETTPRIINIETSQGVNIKDYENKDQPYSKICSYQEECEYNCNPKINIKYNTETADINLLKNIYPTIIKQIEKLLSEKTLWCINIKKDNNLINKIKEILPGSHEDIINISIRYAINNKITIKCNDNEGYIIYVKDHILFQPYCQTLTSGFYNRGRGCHKVKRYGNININKEEKKVVKNISDHYAEFIIYEDEEIVIPNSMERSDIIKDLRKQRYPDIKLNELFGFNFYNKGKGKRICKYQIMQPSLQGNYIFTREDREKRQISGRGAEAITFPGPKEFPSNSCGDGNQSGFSTSDKSMWKKKYDEKLKLLDISKQEESIIIYKLIIEELDSTIDKNILFKLDKSKFCSIIELLLRKKQNNKEGDIEYALGYDNILLPLNNNPETVNYNIKSKNIDSIWKKMNKEKDIFKDKQKNIILEEGYDKEKLQFSYERLDFEEKVKLIDDIIKKKYGGELTKEEEYIFDYVKINFLYKKDGKFYINKDGKKESKPLGFYLFN